MEIRALGGADFQRAIERFAAGGAVTYRGMTLQLRQVELECRVPAPGGAAPLTDGRALEALTRARFRLGALLASAAPLADVIGNRETRYLLTSAAAGGGPVYELRRDRLHRLDAEPPAG